MYQRRDFVDQRFDAKNLAAALRLPCARPTRAAVRPKPVGRKQHHIPGVEDVAWSCSQPEVLQVPNRFFTAAPISF